MQEDTVVKLKNVWKQFNLSKIKDTSLKSSFVGGLSRRSVENSFWALKDINLNLKKGKCLGVIGKNGSGKTTLLKVIAGILKEDKGTIKTKGAVSPLISLGTSFDPELTAKENVKHHCSLMGLSSKELERKYEKIVQFANLHQYMDTKLKHLSEGMKMRVAFATATHFDSDLLLIDEAYSVGDELYREKCNKKLKQLLREGKSIIFASHSLEEIQNVCNSCLMLEKGEIKCAGNPGEVINYYCSRIELEKSERELKCRNRNKELGEGLLLEGEEDRDYALRQGERMKLRFSTSAHLGLLKIGRRGHRRPKQTYDFITAQEGDGELVFSINTGLLPPDNYQILLTLPSANISYPGPLCKVHGSQAKDANAGSTKQPLLLYLDGNIDKLSERASLLLTDRQQAMPKTLAAISSKQSPRLISHPRPEMLDYEYCYKLSSANKITKRGSPSSMIKSEIAHKTEKKLERARKRSKIVCDSSFMLEDSKAIYQFGIETDTAIPITIAFYNHETRDKIAETWLGEQSKTVRFELTSLSCPSYDLELKNDDSILLQAKRLFLPPRYLDRLNKPALEKKGVKENVRNARGDSSKGKPKLSERLKYNSRNFLGMLSQDEVLLLVEELKPKSPLSETEVFRAGGKFSFDIKAVIPHQKTFDVLEKLQKLLQNPDFHLNVIFEDLEDNRLLIDTIARDKLKDITQKFLWDEPSRRLILRVNYPSLRLRPGRYKVHIHLQVPEEFRWDEFGPPSPEFTFSLAESDINFQAVGLNQKSGPNQPIVHETNLLKGVRSVTKTETFERVRNTFKGEWGATFPQDREEKTVKLENLELIGPEAREKWYSDVRRCGYGLMKFKSIKISPKPDTDQNNNATYFLQAVYRGCDEVEEGLIGLILKSERRELILTGKLKTSSQDNKICCSFDARQLPPGDYIASLGLFKPNDLFPNEYEYEDYPYDYIRDIFTLTVSE